MNTKTLISHHYYFKSITTTPNYITSHSPSQCRYTSRIKSSLKSPHHPLFRSDRCFSHVISPNKRASNDYGGHTNERIYAAVTSISDNVEDEDGNDEVVSDLSVIDQDLAGNENIWEQLVEILKFSGPAAGLWFCGPLMSLIDTAVIGQSSSIELAALGIC